VKGWPPFRVTVLIWVVLILTAWNALRLWTAFAWKTQISEYAPQSGPLYIGLTGAVWVTIGLGTLWGIWQPGKRSRLLTVGAAVVYSAWYWSDRLLMQEKRSDWLFVAALNLLLLTWVVFSTKSRYFQREAYEREPEN
jgi:hypothetical protein